MYGPVVPAVRQYPSYQPTNPVAYYSNYYINQPVRPSYSALLQSNQYPNYNYSFYPYQYNPYQTTYRPQTQFLRPIPNNTKVNPTSFYNTYFANPAVNPFVRYPTTQPSNPTSYYNNYYGYPSAYRAPIGNNSNYYTNPYFQRLKAPPTKIPAQGVYDLRQKFPYGITFSWNVDAFKEKKPGIIATIRNRCKKKEPESATKVDPALNNFQLQAKEKEKTLKQNQENEKKSSTKEILKNVSGIVRPGQICAIMGSSGSGKTTLLDVLNFRNREKLSIKDDIRVNGVVVKPNEMREYSGYVEQYNNFIGTLTVKEQLIFNAMLRMDSHLSHEQKLGRVNEIIHQLKLLKCQDKKIGSDDTMQGITSGEKKRVAFASEVLNNPPLLFADEPLSGLDNYMSSNIMDMLVDFAKQGKTIICTVDQPTSQIFERFNTLCLLSEGRVAFMGPRKEAYNFFSKLGYRCPNTYNPADYYTQVLAIRPAMKEQSIEKSKRVCDSFETSEYKQVMNNMIASTNRSAAFIPAIEEQYPKYKASYRSQLKWLMWREGKNLLRNPIYTYLFFIQTILIAVFLGLVYLQLKLNDMGVQNFVAILFILIIHCTFGYIFAVMNNLTSELPILYKELKNRTYSVYMYFLSKHIVETPKFLLAPFIFVVIVYWMASISNNVDVFFRVAFILVLNTQVVIGFAMFLAVLAPNLDVALVISIPILIPFLIFGGFFLNNGSTPDFMIWIKYISWFFYTNEAISSEFWKTVNTIDCTQPRNATGCLPSRCFRNGDDVLSYYLNFNKSNVALDCGILILFLFVYRGLTLLVLKLKSRRK